MSMSIRSFRLAERHWEALRLAAERKGLSQAAVVRLALAEWIEANAGAELGALWRGEGTSKGGPKPAGGA